MEPIDSIKRQTTISMDIFLRNFSKVPDDKLTWVPAPTAKSALRIAAHTALYACRFAKMIRDQALPAPSNISEWVAQRDAEEEAITDREQIETIFREGTAEVLAALDALTEADINVVIDSGQGWPMSMRYLITLPAWHTANHTGQIDFLQTCWDDQHVYVG